MNITSTTPESTQPITDNFATAPRPEQKPTDQPVTVVDIKHRARFVIKNDSDRQTLLTYLRIPGRHLPYIDSVQALENQYLSRTVTIVDSRYQINQQGGLFDQQAETVVIDTTRMNPDDIASLNDLLDNKPSYQGKDIGAHIRQILLTDQKTTEMLGQDFHRRARRFSKTRLPSPASPVLTDSELRDTFIKPFEPSGETTNNRVIVDFYLGSDWRTPLLGGPVLNKKEGITHKQGRLAELKSGGELVLRNAPWNSASMPDQAPSDFEKCVLTALREKGFELYSQWLPLPDNITIYRDDTTKDDIDKKIASYQVCLNPDARFIQVNQATMDFLDNPTRINDEGDPESFNPLEEWIGDCEQIRITDDLSLRQKLQFFRYYEKIKRDKRPPLVMNNDGIHEEETTPFFAVHRGEIDYGDLKGSLNLQDTVNWDNLFQRISLKSRNRNKFDYEDGQGDILEWLTSDSPELKSDSENDSADILYISGIEAGSQPAKKLATLNENPSYLFIHGRKRIIPDCVRQHRKVTLLPPSVKIKPVTIHQIESHIFKNNYNFDIGVKVQIIFSLKEIFSLCNTINREIIAQQKSAQQQPLILKNMQTFLWQLHYSHFIHGVNLCSDIPSTLGNLLILLKITQRLFARPWRRIQPKVYDFILCQFRKNFPEVVEYPLFDRNSLSDCLNYTSPNKETFSLTGYRPPVPKADRDGLRCWLSLHPEPDRNTLREHFWSLARCCPVWELDTLPDTMAADPDDKYLKQLAVWLVGAAEPAQQSRLASVLEIATDSFKHLQYYNGQTIKQLNRWLGFHQPDVIMEAPADREKLKTLFGQLSDIVATLENPNLSELDKIQKITPLLTHNITRSEKLPPGFRDFPHALVYGHRHGYLRQQVRIKKLSMNIGDLSFPIIFLNGRNGTGKSLLAERAVVQYLNRFTPTHAQYIRTFTVGPHTTRGDLFARDVIKQRNDGDDYSVYKKGPLLMSINHTRSQYPPYLVLKGVERIAPAMLAPLEGLALPVNTRMISFSGKRYYSTAIGFGYCFILTGNLAADGRPGLDPALADAAVILDIPPMAPDELARGIIRPALPGHWSARLKGHVCGTLLALLHQYQHLLPEEHLLNPREIKDLLAVIHHSLASYQSHSAQALSEPDIPMVNGLILDAIRLCIEHRIATDQQSQLATLKAWYQVRFPENPELLTIRDQQFNQFLKQLRENNPGKDLNVPPFVELIRRYWLFLEQGDGGRTVLMVEGPSGWGKDLLLDSVWLLWNEQRPEAFRSALHLTASPGRWDQLSEQVRRAAQAGQVIAISELNLIDPASLEGLLNDVMDTAKPGFRLIATVNPGTFPGRKPLSPALKDRFARFTLASLGRDNISKVLTRLIGKENSALVDWLTHHFTHLCEALSAKQSAMMPAMAELVAVVEKLTNLPETLWPELFADYFDEELEELNLGIEALSALPLVPDESAPHLAPTFEMPDEKEELTVLSGLPDYLINPEKYGLQDADLVWPDPPAYKGPSSFGSSASHQQKPAASSVTGAITRHMTLRYHKRFACNRYSPGDYRLVISRLGFQSENQKVTCDPINLMSQGLSPVIVPPPSSIACFANLPPEHVLGAHSVVLDHNSWHPLPGLSSRDELITIRSRNRPNLLFDMARSNTTGQLLVKLARGFSKQEVQLDFVIKPSAQQPPETIQIASNLLDETVHAVLDNFFFSGLWKGAADNGNVPETLLNILDTKDVKEKIIQLAAWLRTFQSNQDVEGEGLTLLLNLITAQQGTCKHRSMVFELLARYFGVPARQVLNDSHQYVEYSPDQGQSWYRLDLGGGGNYRHKESSEDFLNTKAIRKPEPVLQQTARGAMKPTHAVEKTQTAPQRPILRPVLPLIEAKDIHHWLNSMDALLQNGSIQNSNGSDQIGDIFQADAFIGHLRQMPSGPEIAIQALAKVQELEGSLNDTIHNKLRLLNIFFASSMRLNVLFTVAAEVMESADESSLPTLEILPMLEAMVQYPATAQMALALLNRFYQEAFSQNPDWPFVHQPPQAAGFSLQMPSPYLCRILSRSVPRVGWSPLPTGKPPSIARMAIGLDAYPKTVSTSGGRNPCIIHLQGSWLKRLEGLLQLYTAHTAHTAQHAYDEDGFLPLKPLKKCCLSPSTEQFATTLHTFLHWLASHDDQGRWCWLVSRAATNPTGKDAVVINPGCYQTPPPLAAVKALLQTDNSGTELNPNRLKTVANMPKEAHYLNSKQLETLFQEFLQKEKNSGRFTQ